jgi:flagellar hook assembly protein FlgD
VVIDIYNTLGQKVKTVLDSEKPAGNYTIYWDGTNNKGEMVATGIYYYQLRIDDFVESKKMVLLK